MAFMMKKKKYKFAVDVCIDELTAVPFVSAVLFAKVRLLDGGSFSEASSREEVQDHKVKWGANFSFQCKMSANASTGVLDQCILRVSVRKELKGGRSFQKLGFCDLNLAEFAGSGQTTRRCLLEGYDTRHRQDNSMLMVSITMNMLSGDVLFKVPSPSLKHKQMIVSVAPDETNERHREDYSSGSIASGSSGCGSLKKRPVLFNSELVPDGPHLEPGDLGIVPTAGPGPGVAEAEENHEAAPGHSRNSSNTSQLSKGSGYGSLNSQHSRQSSSGDSTHIRSPSWPGWNPRLAPIPSTPTTTPPSPRQRLSPTKTNGRLRSNNPPSPLLLCTPQRPPPGSNFRFPPWSGPSPRASSSPTIPCPLSPLAASLPNEGANQRNASSGSGLSETGSLDRGKAALERRKKAAEEGSGGGGRVEASRVNPDPLIDQLIQETNLEPSETEMSGLQLYIAKDGTTALGSHEVKSLGVFKQVVMDDRQYCYIVMEERLNSAKFVHTSS
ncbi:early estrogen-induced gene 1 protein isoform X1 [Macrosteles quadrilineatus]|uniref:early estrogen-induced gene 1 protein isoform X1 n=1 Tax=Macrosteles quadrilineatus TaxID=74068 RepID=UPI0023E25A0B|nr:early estrogen-induced gene 1 protein isoform X1 [Macrosteles quadrilineatus]XP_054270877.1 early estrogen-induced gene 1 protein isoform X1 [Macrosteles quadrilineatus]XP_054270878.1 early estrogen-induced gene 1 protein isoform X1 [Macrosteles quadrilineatus]XP_054270879.1 early estrogen-induced gene 1 protein isoform X1 [Macrosteles quadrilineatus]XP_054270880.1 early estrogen-induced gene 1 protein isoform X1 [Macrosteles quadrilineatus]XP_054270881.1 early estrogen-induced gene 1 prote